MVIENPTGLRPAAVERPPTGRSLGVVHAALDGVAPMPFVGLTGGEFTIGGEAYKDEKPRHRVSLPAFQIATTPVTVRQWRAVMRSVPGDNGDGDERPVVNVSWLDAIDFLNRLSDDMRLPRCYERHGDEVSWTRTVDGYRLPTEAEWEYAARGGTTTEYSFGDDTDAMDRYAWHAGNSGGHPHPVGTREANPFGLYDIHGNVWEWVQDWYGPYGEEGVDVGGPGSGDRRVLRGGCFADVPRVLRSAVRDWLWPSVENGFDGLRVARGARAQPLAR